MTAHVFRDGYDFTIAVECCNAMAAAGAFKQRLFFPQLVSYLEEFSRFMVKVLSRRAS